MEIEDEYREEARRVIEAYRKCKGPIILSPIEATRAENYIIQLLAEAEQEKKEGQR